MAYAVTFDGYAIFRLPEGEAHVRTYRPDQLLYGTVIGTSENDIHSKLERERIKTARNYREPIEEFLR